MWDIIIWWAITFACVIATAWLVTYLYDSFFNGGLSALIVAFLAIFIRPLRNFVNQKMERFITLNSRLSFALSLLVFFAFIYIFLIKQFDNKVIIFFLTSPFTILVWAVISIGFTTQLATDFSTSQSIGRAGANASIYISLPCFLILLSFSPEGRYDFIFYAACFGILFGVISSMLVQRVYRNRIKEIKLNTRDDEAIVKLKSIIGWVDIIRYIPRLLPVRRDMAYLCGIRERAWKHTTHGRFEEAESTYELFEFEFPRISRQMKSEFSTNFRKELVSQLQEQSLRAEKIAQGVDNSNLKRAIQDVKGEIDSAQERLIAIKNWNISEDFQQHSDNIVGFLSKLDRLEAIGTDQELELDDVIESLDLSNANEIIMIGQKLGIETNKLQNSLDVFYENRSSIKDFKYDSAFELKSNIDKIETQVESSNQELGCVKMKIAENYKIHIYDERILWIAPKLATSKEESKALILIKNWPNIDKHEEITVKLYGIGIEFGNSQFSFRKDDSYPQCKDIIFKPNSSKRTTMQILVSQIGLTKTDIEGNHEMHVIPTTFEIIQDVGTVSAAIACISAVLLFILKRDQSEIALISGTFAVLYFLYRIVGLHWTRRISFHTSSER